MKALKILLPVLALTLSAASAQTIRVYPTPSASNLELGLTGGYYNGGGAQVFIGARNIAGPIGARLSASFAGNSGGFDENTAIVNGLPATGINTVAGLKAAGATTKSRSTTVGLDATYGLGEVANNIDATVYGGLRYGHFRSSLEYNGTTTDYTSNRFGLGAGVEVGYPITNKLSAIANVGADYYMKSDITSDDNKGTTDTQSADNLSYVKQPSGMFKAGVGLKYRF